jgi:hypothetical protein
MTNDNFFDQLAVHVALRQTSEQSQSKDSFHDDVNKLN